MKKCWHLLIVALFTVSFHTERTLGADAEQDFASWLKGIRSDALAAGVNEEILDPILTDIELLPRVIEQDTNQP